MIKLMGIAKGLSPKKIVKEAMETQELAEEYAKDIENMITQIDDFEDEMTQIENKDELLFRVVFNSQHYNIQTNYVLPERWLELVDQTDELAGKAYRCEKQLRKWERKINKFFCISVKQLIHNWKLNVDREVNSQY